MRVNGNENLPPRRRGSTRAAVIALALAAPTLSARDLLTSEIHAAPARGWPAFVELFNPSPRPLSVGGWRLRGDARYSFPAGSTVPGRGWIVLTDDLELFRERFGFEATGEYSGKLPADGGELRIEDAERRSIERSEYAIEPGAAADRGGASLERVATFSDPTRAASWARSWAIGGTPGRTNSRAEAFSTEALVPPGARWRYFKGRSEPLGDALAWTGANYDDGSWAEDPASFGFGNFDDATVLDDMRESYSSLYLRRTFDYSPSGEDIVDLVFTTLFDDGFVAWLNGEEIARRNTGEPGTPVRHDDVATERQRAEGVPAVIHLSSRADLLVPGTNVLAVYAVNDHVRGSDFVIDPKLELATRRPRPPEVTLNELWRDGGTLRLELRNASPHAVDLSGAQLLDAEALASEAPSPVTTLPPGTVLPANGFSTLELPNELDGKRLALRTADGDRLIDARWFPRAPESGSLGRFPSGDPSSDASGDPVRWLERATPAAPNVPPAPGAAVITEILYRPTSGSEFIEIVARERVDLGYGRVSGGVEYLFPEDVVLEAGERLVVAEEPDEIDVPPETMVLGPFAGRLSSRGETLVLSDGRGRELDRVRYAAGGTWPEEPDESGVSLELVEAALENEAGGAWLPSLAVGGTPGRANSVEGERVPRQIWDVTHTPLVPTPGDAISIRARAEDSVPAATLRYRVAGDGALAELPMRAEDGFWIGEIPPQVDGAVIEFQIEVCGPESRGRRECGVFPYGGEPDTALFEVDTDRDSPLDEDYRLVLRPADVAALAEDPLSNVQRPATFIAGGKAYYRARVRYRGSGSRLLDPKSYRIRFRDEDRFPDGRTIFLNAFQPHRQVMGMDLWRRVGLPYSRARLVRLVFDGQLFPRYAQLEPIDRAYLRRHFSDDDGNLYRGRDEAVFDYRGDDPAAYVEHYNKETNERDGDFSDIIELCRVFSETPEDEFRATISRRIDARQWIETLAVHGALSNQEGGIYRDTGDDYFIYSPEGGRFVLLPWDMDSVYLESEERLVRPSVPAIRRLLEIPEYSRHYYRTLRDLVSTHFTVEATARQARRIERGYDLEGQDEFVTFVRERSAFIRRHVERTLSASVAEGGVGSGRRLFAIAEDLVLSGTAPPAEAARVTVAGREAEYSAVDGIWRIAISARTDRRLRIRAFDEDGETIARLDATLERISPERVVSTLPPGETQFAADGAPWILAPDLKVPANASVRIDAGAHVLLAPSGELLVDGNLDAVGSADRPIVFGLSIPGGSGQRIHFLNGSRGRLEHVRFVFASGEFDPSTPAKPFIENEKGNVSVRNSHFEGIPGVVLEAIDGRLEVADCTFRRTGEAIHGVTSTVIATGNTIEDVHGDQDAIDLDGELDREPGASRIAGNLIRGGSDDGIDLLASSALIEGNVMIDCGDRAISIEGLGSPSIRKNVIVDCRDGIVLKDGTTATGDHNTVTGCLNGVAALVKTAGALGAHGTFHSSIVWGNDVDVSVDLDSTLEISRSNLGTDPDFWGVENVSLDPEFVAQRDVRLRAGSPCLGTGRDGTDMGARGLASSEPPAIAKILPARGSVLGGDVVTVTGAGLTSATRVLVGERELFDLALLPSGDLRGLAPPAVRADSVDVIVETAHGTDRQAGAYVYARDILTGDANGDRRLDVTDAVTVLRHLFGAREGATEVAIVCPSVADFDRNGSVAINDPIAFLNYLYGGGRAASPLRVDCE